MWNITSTHIEVYCSVGIFMISCLFSKFISCFRNQRFYNCKTASFFLFAPFQLRVTTTSNLRAWTFNTRKYMSFKIKSFFLPTKTTQKLFKGNRKRSLNISNGKERLMRLKVRLYYHSPFLKFAQKCGLMLVIMMLKCFELKLKH